MQYFHDQQFQIAYTRQGEGMPILFLHNGGTSHTIWNALAMHFAQGYSVYSFDLLGYGASSSFGSEDDIQRHLSLLENFIEKENIDELILVGNCMGSAISLLYAQKYPQKVKALILINLLSYHSFEKGKLGLFLTLRNKFPKLTNPLYKLVARFRIPHFLSPLAIRLQLGKQGKENKIDQNPHLNHCFTREGQMQALIGTLDDLTQYKSIDQIERPELFPPICSVWGLENKILSVRAGRKLNEQLKPNKEVWMQGCGHLPMMEKPEELIKEIDIFLEQHR